MKSGKYIKKLGRYIKSNFCEKDVSVTKYKGENVKFLKRVYRLSFNDN